MAEARTAAQAGWRESIYNICAWETDEDDPVIANLFAGTMQKVPLLEYALLKSLDRMSETHPAIERLARRGLVVDFDERERLASMGTAVVAGSPKVLKMTICPTMACNFECPYCFQEHRAGKMAEGVQDEVAALADRLLATSAASELFVMWYGGEPLLALDVIDRLTRLLNSVCKKHGAGLRASIITNGYLLDGQTARDLFHLRVKGARVTVDGMGATHDATRRLVGGGPTFERIMENLSSPIPFPVEIRQNVHAGNRGEMEELRGCLLQAAAENGNVFRFSEAEVFDSDVFHSRDDVPQLVDEREAKQLSLQRANLSLHGARARRCTAQAPFGICVDEKGRLYSCSATLALPQYAFGDARTWDPADPDTTTIAPENRDWFLKESLPQNDPECRECVWLPACAGGCAWLRLRGRRDCVPWKDDPEGFVLAQYARMGEKLPDADYRLTPEKVAAAVAPILRKRGVARAWVYGSVAAGTAGARSDVDMVVEMPPGEYLGWGFFDLRRELREALGRKVDLHTPPNESSTEAVANVIGRSAVLVYDDEGFG